MWKMDHELIFVTASSELEKCFDTFKALRPHINKDDFIEQVLRQQKSGYNIIAVKEGNRVVSVGGFRVSECLAWGKILYLDDLGTLPEYRGKGYAAKIMDWLIDHAKAEGCDALHLDTGHHRHEAHKLYLKKGLSITSHHLSLKLVELDK